MLYSLIPHCKGTTSFLEKFLQLLSADQYVCSRIVDFSQFNFTPVAMHEHWKLSNYQGGGEGGGENAATATISSPTLVVVSYVQWPWCIIHHHYYVKLPLHGSLLWPCFLVVFIFFFNFPYYFQFTAICLRRTRKWDQTRLWLKIQ